MWSSEGRQNERGGRRTFHSFADLGGLRTAQDQESGGVVVTVEGEEEVLKVGEGLATIL